MKQNKAIILNGKLLAENILEQIKQEIEQIGLTPGLAAILVGDDPASKMYLELKEKACKKVGINFNKYLCNSQCYDNIDEKELLEMIEFLNQDKQIDGILIQLPLPSRFNTNKIIKAIDPNKDVDGFYNGKITPPTIAAIIELLKMTKENLANKTAIIIGKSDIFINNLETHLLNLGIKKVTKEKNSQQPYFDYDIVIVAYGQPYFLKSENIKNEAIVIDVGINKLNGITVGDVDPQVVNKASFISPVPGGVGPLTVACLLRNILELTKQH